MVYQVSLFSRFLLLLNMPQTRQSDVVSTRLFFRLGKDQKSPSVVPIDIEPTEAPEDFTTEIDEGFEPEAIDFPEDLGTEDISEDITEIEIVDSLDSIDDYEYMPWDPLAEEAELSEVLEEATADLNKPIASEKEDIATDITEEAEEVAEVANSEEADTVSEVNNDEPEISAANSEVIGVDGENGADGLDGESVDSLDNGDNPDSEAADDGAIAEDQVPNNLDDLTDETLDTLDQDVVETGDEAIDPVADVADDIEEIDETGDGEPEQEELEVLGDSSDTEPNLLSQVESGFYTVDATGKVEFTFVFDSGAYEGQLAAISMTGMENLDINSQEFFQESLQRALSGSEAKLGYIVIDDISAGAMFDGELEPSFDYNHGEFVGTSIVEFRAGDKFFLMLIPNGSVGEVEEALEAGTTKDVRPLFSLVAANPTKAIQMGQIVDVTGDGNTYVFEDIRQDGASDKDFNDLIFQVKGATITTVTLDELILEGEMSPEADWRTTEIGQQIVDYAASQVVIVPEPNPVEKYEFPKEDQPLIGFIDTHFTQGNPDIDYSRIIFGKDYIQNDSDPTIVAVAGEGTHGDHILGIVAATQDNGLGIDGINDDAPLWVSSAVESGKWADALVEFVDAAKASNQPNAIINLSIDLTQVNPDGTVTTRYEFTPQERGAIEYARQNGVLIVAAAGNDGGVMSVLGQASQEFDNIITVGSSDGLTRAEYSSYGQGLGILAPGGTASDPELSLTGKGVGLMSGTSVATAKVTGAVSQVWAANPELSYRQVIEILKSTATDLSTPGWDVETGAGLLNMVAAVQAAKITIPVVHKPEPLFAPDKWWGEGKLTPLEMAVKTEGIIDPGKPKVWSKEIRDEEYRIGEMFGGNRFGTFKLGRRGSFEFDTISSTGIKGKLQPYATGAIYWSSRNKAVALWGELLHEYQIMDGPKSFLGHPKKREYDWKGGKRADFDGGYLYWNGYFSQAFKYNEMPPPYTPPTPIPPTPIPTPIPVPTPPVPTYLPGTGLVPTSAGTFLGKVVSASGVVMHYYQSGYLVEQPGNRLYWYASPSGAGFNPVQRVTNKPTPLIDPVATTIMESAIDLFDNPKRDQNNKGGGFPSSKSGKVGGATGKTAYYKFTLEGLRDINFKLSGLSADADLKLWSPDTKEFYSIRKSGKSVEEFRRILPGGEYYLVVEPMAGATETPFRVDVNVRPAEKDKARYKGLDSNKLYRYEKGKLREFLSPGRNALKNAHAVPDEDLELFDFGEPITAEEEDKRLAGLSLNGGYNSMLGDPTSGVMTAGTSPQGTTGYWQSYQNGMIHSSGRYGAVPLWFDLAKVYAQNGGSSNWLGFPTRAEYEWEFGKRTDFEGGYLFFNPQDGSVRAYKLNEAPQRPITNQPPKLSFPTFIMPYGSNYSFTLGQYRHELEISDPDGDAIQLYEIKVDPTKIDMEGWSQEGLPSGTFLMPADKLNDVRFYGSVAGTYPVQIRAYDGKAWSDSHTFNLTVNQSATSTTIGAGSSAGGGGSIGGGGASGGIGVVGQPESIGKGGTTRTGASGISISVSQQQQIELEFKIFDKVSQFIYKEMMNNPSKFNNIMKGLSPNYDQTNPSLLLWFSLVNDGGDWDHKPILQSKNYYDEYFDSDLFTHFPNDTEYEYFYDFWSNIHYGFVGSAIGIKNSDLRFFSWLNDLAKQNFFNATDLASVDLGIQLWNKYGLGLSLENFREFVISNKQKFIRRKSSIYKNSSISSSQSSSANYGYP